jgi:hypothetical protein
MTLPCEEEMQAGNPSHEELWEADRKLPSDWEPVPGGPHRTLRLHACPVHAELTQRAAGYLYMPPLLQDLLERARFLKDQKSDKGYGPN